MPIWLKKSQADYKMAIWKIEEPEIFFSQEIQLEAKGKLPHRRLEYLAARYLLAQLAPELPLQSIRTDEHGKPFCVRPNLHFSISHSFPYVGVIVATLPVGIDVQVHQEKILRIKHKFLTEKELRLLNEDISSITLAWAAKEAAFKWSDYHGFDFRKHLIIETFSQSSLQAEIQLRVKRVAPATLLTLIGAAEKDFGWMLTLPKNSNQPKFNPSNS